MENIDDWRMRASIAESEAATLRVEVERLRGLFKTLQQVTGQVRHFPVGYEDFVQRVTHQALKGDAR